MIKEFKTPTGAIFSDTKNCLEYLYVGDYGKEANIKADFLGLTKEINGVIHKKVDLEDNRNLFVVSVILIAGIGGLSLTFGKVTITSIACALILGIITNVILSGKKSKN